MLLASNFLNTYEFFLRLEKNPKDFEAYSRLCAIQGYAKAESIKASILSPTSWHPVAMYPHQAKFVAMNESRLRPRIIQDWNRLGLNWVDYNASALGIENSQVERILKILGDSDEKGWMVFILE